MVIDGKASLSIKSLTHPASKVTSILGLEPTASAEQGDPVGRVRTGADGKPSMRERTSSIWVLDAPDSDPNDHTGFSSVQSLVKLLEKKRKAIEKLKDHYFIEIAWNGFSDRPQAGFLVPSELLAVMGSLGLDFHGTVYLATDDAAPEPEQGAAVAIVAADEAQPVDEPDVAQPAEQDAAEPIEADARADSEAEARFDSEGGAADPVDTEAQPQHEHSDESA